MLRFSHSMDCSHHEVINLNNQENGAEARVRSVNKTVNHSLGSRINISFSANVPKSPKPTDEDGIQDARSVRRGLYVPILVNGLDGRSHIEWIHLVLKKKKTIKTTQVNVMTYVKI